MVGSIVGKYVGSTDDGDIVGIEVVGRDVGCTVGSDVGSMVGSIVGLKVGLDIYKIEYTNSYRFANVKQCQISNDFLLQSRLHFENEN